MQAPSGASPLDASVLQPKVTALPSVDGVDAGRKAQVPRIAETPIRFATRVQIHHETVAPSAWTVECDPRGPTTVLHNNCCTAREPGWDQICRVHAAGYEIPPPG